MLVQPCSGGMVGEKKREEPLTCDGLAYRFAIAQQFAQRAGTDCMSKCKFTCYMYLSDASLSYCISCVPVQIACRNALLI